MLFNTGEYPVDFRYIIDKQQRTGPLQGSLKVTIDHRVEGEENMSDTEIVLSRLENYCMEAHFECIIKEI